MVSPCHLANGAVVIDCSLLVGNTDSGGIRAWWRYGLKAGQVSELVALGRGDTTRCSFRLVQFELRIGKKSAKSEAQVGRFRRTGKLNMAIPAETRSI